MEQRVICATVHWCVCPVVGIAIPRLQFTKAGSEDASSPDDTCTQYYTSRSSSSRARHGAPKANAGLPRYLLQFTTIYYNLQQKLVPPNKLEPISFSSTKAKNSETLSEIVRAVFKILRKA